MPCGSTIRCSERMERRRFLKLVGGGAAALAIPVKTSPLAVVEEAVKAETIKVAAVSSSWSKSLWPGISKWFFEEYENWDSDFSPILLEEKLADMTAEMYEVR